MRHARRAETRRRRLPDARNWRRMSMVKSSPRRTCNDPSRYRDRAGCGSASVSQPDLNPARRSLVRHGTLRYPFDMNEDFSRFFKPGCVHRQLYTDPAIFELEMARIFGTAWIYIGHESQVKKPGDYFATQIGRHPVVMTRDDERRAARDPQPVRPPRRDGGGDRKGQRRRIHLLLSRLDLSSRRPAQGRAAQPRLSARLQGRRSEDGDAVGGAGEELSRLRVRQRSGRRPEPGRIARPHDHVARRHDRPRAGRRDRGGRRRVQARL